MTRRVAAHTRACGDALGMPAGLDAIARAGFTDVVLWAGPDGEHTRGIYEAAARGLGVTAVALPKARSTDAGEWAALCARAAAVRDRTTAAISVILGDGLDAPEGDVCARLAALPPPVLIENCGRRAERFSSLRAVADLLARVPTLMLALDLGHLAAVGGAVGELPEDLRSRRLFQVELHDNDGDQDLHLPLGSGTGSGRSEALLARLGVGPERVVIETDPRLGGDPEGWVRALRQEREALVARLAGARSPSPLAGEVARQGRRGGSIDKSPSPYPLPRGEGGRE